MTIGFAVAKIYLICHVTLQDHVWRYGSSSLHIPTLVRLVVMGIVVVDV